MQLPQLGEMSCFVHNPLNNTIHVLEYPVMQNKSGKNQYSLSTYMESNGYNDRKFVPMDNDLDEDSVVEKAPEGWEGTVKAMKKNKDIDNPWALANYMKNKGYKSHENESADDLEDFDVDPELDPDTLALDYDSDLDNEKKIDIPYSDRDEPLTETHDSDLQRLEQRFPHEFKRFRNGASCADFGDAFFDAVFDHYLHSGEMPYAVAKGRTEDPTRWCDQRLAQDLRISRNASLPMDESSKNQEQDKMDAELSHLAKLAGLRVTESVSLRECTDVMQQIQQPQEGRLSISTSMSTDGNNSVNISADGEKAAELMRLLKLAGLGGETSESEVRVIDVAEARELANSPDPKYGTVEQQLDQGTDLNRKKRQDPKTANKAANPMTDADPIKDMGRKLMREYEGMKVAEGKKAKPDFLDIDGDGDKTESMRKAVADKKSK